MRCAMASFWHAQAMRLFECDRRATTRSSTPALRVLVDDVIAAVDVEGLAGDQTGRVMRQEGRRGADIVDADETAGRRFRLRLVEQRVEFRDPRGCPGRERAGRDGMHANSLRSELGRDV